MTKMLTLRSLLLALLFAAGFQVSFAQTPFWTETFSDASATAGNWTQAGSNDGPVSWAWTDIVDAGNWGPGPFTAPTAATGYIWFDSDGNGEGFPYDLEMTGTGVPANCSGKSNVHLKFSSYFRTFTGTDVANVGISTDGTNFTYHNIAQFDNLAAETANNPQLYQGDIDIAIPEADGAAQVWVQFHTSGEFEYYWKVDDVSLYEYTPSTVNVTFRVNMALQTVDPAGAYLAGSFNGWNGEAMTNEGNGVWSLTKALTAGVAYQYKFKNGTSTWEQAPAACGVDDGFGGFNRGITPDADVILPAICFAACAPCVLPCNLNPNSIICDNFDTYVTTQKLGPQATWWTTWDGVEGTAEDGIVSTEQASSPTKSLKVVSTATTGGPQDVVLNLGNKTTGHYELKWKIYVPAGKNAYYNIQDVIPIPASPVTENWNLDVFFENNGTGRVAIETVDQNTFSYTNGQWIEVRHDIDLDNNVLRLYVGGQLAGKYAYPDNLGGIDFYGINNVSTFYIDDVEYVQLAAVVPNVDICDVAVELTQYFGAAIGSVQTTGLQNNTTATASSTDPAVTCWNEEISGTTDIVDKSMWYTFAGDGKYYHIETVPCNATNYIGGAGDPGDTQMLIYSGESCDDLTEIACNDDLYNTGDPDWRSGLDLQTEAGANYYMMIDGFNFQGQIATGQYCIEITQKASVTCADGAVGAYEVASPYLCEGAQLADLITLDEASFILPNEGEQAGLSWAVSGAALDGSVYPADDQNYIGSTGVIAAPFSVSLLNDGSFNPGIYYITPVVIGGGTTIDPTITPVRLENIDVSNGCYYVGQSTQIFVLPTLTDITATVTTGNGSVDLTPAGGLGELLGDETLYTYQWSNGATTQDLNGVPAGTYTCIVNDVSGCAFETVVTAQVTVGTKDPASVQTFTVSPNPTTGKVMVSLALATASDVRVDVLNTLGQTIQSQNFDNVNRLNQSVELGNVPQGSYLLRVTVDGETAIRRVVVQR